MKKYTQSNKFTTYLNRRGRRQLKKNRIFKLHIKHKNLLKYGVKIIEVHYRKRLAELKQNYDQVQAPINFSFRDNPNEVIEFINILKDNYDNRKETLVDLEKVKKIDYDAILLLFSIMIRFKALNIDFNGNFPKNNRAKYKLIESGFFESLYKKNFADQNRYDLVQDDNHNILTHAYKNVDSELGARIISSASKTIWGSQKRCQGAQRTLLELMQNTNNHASLNSEGDKHWWLSVYHDKSNKKVIFSFIDYGIGVFNSLANKQESSKFFRAIEKLLERFKYGNNAELFRLILNGDLHQTVTGEHYRGKGLPGIKEAMDRNQISKLVIITNNVLSETFNGNYKLLNNTFAGTFISWELNANNKYCNE